MIVLSSGNNGGGGGAVSDARLKTDIKPVGMTSMGLPLYQYRYVGGQQTFEGVMAQDVAKVMPEAIIPIGFGYMAVDYDMLGLEMRAVR
nr:tail fiber domain-containing protein [Sulfitobacter alexandrii]